MWRRKKLIKAHIVPRNFYLNRKNEKYRSVDVQTGHWKQCQSGTYDSNILCEDCDGKIIKLFDDEAYKVLLNYEYINPMQENASSKLFKLCSDQFNYDLLRKFFVSVLWRASISNLAEFQSINLGKYEKMALDILKGADDYDNFFKVLVFKYPDRKKFNKVLYIDKGRFYRANTYILVLGLFEIVIIPNCSGVSTNIFNIFNKIFMSEENLYILEDEEVYEKKLSRLLYFTKNWKTKIK